MSGAGAVELGRRGAVLVLLVSALVSIPRSAPTSVVLALAALAVYVLLPRVRRPAGAFVYDRMPAVVMPDLLGFALVSFFVALPFWAAGSAGDPGSMVHPMAILTWPMALAGLAILIIAGRHACYWLTIEGDGLRIAKARGERSIPFSKIVAVEPYRRGLPRWMRALAPLLVATGKFTAAGAILVSRDTTGMALRLADGSAEIIAEQGFEKPYGKVVAALRGRSVPVGPGV